MNQAGSPIRYDNDEIDLRELFANLWAERLRILAVTLLVTAAAAAYAFLTTPVYEAKSSLLPPQLSDVAGFNVGRAAVNQPNFTVADVYGVFTRNLSSDALRRSFFQEIYLPALSERERSDAQDKLWKRFNEKVLSVSVLDKKEHPEYFQVRIEYKNPELAAKWVNLYVERAAELTRNNMQENALHEIDIRVQEIERRIAVLRESALQRRQDRIAHLKEALMVADTVGVNAPQVTTGRTSSDSTLSSFVDGSLMYMRGAKAIRAELQALESRKSDDPFISELRDLEAQLVFLKSIDVKPDSVAVFNLDSRADVPETPIKPNKVLILAVGGGLGSILGLFIVLVRQMLRKSQQPLTNG